MGKDSGFEGDPLKRMLRRIDPPATQLGPVRLVGGAVGGLTRIQALDADNLVRASRSDGG